MKALLFPLVMAISAAGGVMAADFARGTQSGGDSHASDEQADADGHGESASHGGGHGEGGYGVSDGDTEYLRFKRQFVVPVVENQNVRSLVLMNIALEVPASKRDDMFRLEPRFRDAFIRELLQLSDTGYFDSTLTSPDTYEAMRETLLRSAKNINSEGVVDVLILDLSRQDS